MSRALVVVPVEPLVPGVGYTLTLLPGAARGLDGTELSDPLDLSFRAVSGPPLTDPDPIDFARDLQPLFEARCGCHGPAPQMPPALTPEALVGEPSWRQPARLLVEPGRPLSSMLVRKLLPDYPGVPGEQMPPDGPLAEDELRLVVEWVGAL